MDKPLFVPEAGVYKDPERIVPELGNAPPVPAPVAEPSGPQIGERVAVGPDEKQEPVRQTLAGTDVCEKCGRSTDSKVPEVDVTLEDKQAWLRHVLGEPRFCREYRLMGGVLKVTLRTRKLSESDMVFKQLGEDMLDGTISPVPAYSNPEYFMRMHRLMLPFSLQRVETSHGDGKVSVVDYKEVVEADYPECAGRVAKAAEARLAEAMPSESIYGMLLGCLQHFELLVTTLTRRSTDENFWKAAGGRG